MLNPLNDNLQMTDSRFLRNLCEQIDKKVQEEEEVRNFKKNKDTRIFKDYNKSKNNRKGELDFDDFC